jgi:hypothetical protein
VGDRIQKANDEAIDNHHFARMRQVNDNASTLQQHQPERPPSYAHNRFVHDHDRQGKIAK